MSKDSIVDLEITISGSFCLHRNIITIAVFYALPVIQLVITYQTVSAALNPRIQASHCRERSLLWLTEKGLTWGRSKNYFLTWVPIGLLHCFIVDWPLNLVPNCFITEGPGTSWIILSTNLKLLPCTHLVIVLINCVYYFPVWTSELLKIME